MTIDLKFLLEKSKLDDKFRRRLAARVRKIQKMPAGERMMLMLGVRKFQELESKREQEKREDEHRSGCVYCGNELTLEACESLQEGLAKDDYDFEDYSPTAWPSYLPKRQAG